jgi:lysophospholipase L1-like esterase
MIGRSLTALVLLAALGFAPASPANADDTTVH